jgi:hypothetical protein
MTIRQILLGHLDEIKSPEIIVEYWALLVTQAQT